MTIFGVIMALFLVLNLFSYLFYPAFMPWFEQREAGEKIINDQIDADVALQNYRYFRSQWHDIKAKRAQIQNLWDEHERFHRLHGNDTGDWARSTRIRHGRIHERIVGNRNALESMVAEYNARSSDATRSMFKCHLPYQVDEQFAITGPPGSGPAEQPQDQYVEGADPDQTPPPPAECDGLPESVQATAAS